MPAPRVAAPTLARLGLSNAQSMIAVAAVTVFVVVATASIETTSLVLETARRAVVLHLGGLFVLVANVAVGSVVLLACVPRANVRLGPPGAKPDFGAVSWFAMLFSAGLASGLLYWATAEPILHLQSNPFVSGDAVGGSDEAVRAALRLTVLHWGLHGWALYVLAALAIAIYSYRHGQPLAVRTALHPLLGARRLAGWPGRVIDLVALFGTVCGVATSIGLSASSMNATLHALFGTRVSTAHQVAIIFGVCALGTASAISGLSRGVRRLSELNVWSSAVLVVAVFAWGPTAYLGEQIARTLLDYALHAIPNGLWLARTPEERLWQGDWTIFYWAWWLAWMPFVSLFIARISRGRTLREFAIAVLLVPTLVTLVWMCVFGGAAIAREQAAPGGLSAVVAADYSLGLVEVLEGLGSPFVAGALTALACVLLFTWLVTSIDSATLMISEPV